MARSGRPARGSEAAPGWLVPPRFRLSPPHPPHTASVCGRGSFPPRVSPSVSPSSVSALISTYSWMSLKGASAARLVLQAPHLSSQLPVWSSRWPLRVGMPQPWTVLPAPVLRERCRHLLLGTDRNGSRSETL